MTTEDILLVVESHRADDGAGLSAAYIRQILLASGHYSVGDGQRFGRLLAQMVRDDKLVERDGFFFPVDRSRGGF